MVGFEGLGFHVMVAHLHVGLHRDRDMTGAETEAERGLRPRLAGTERFGVCTCLFTRILVYI